MGEVERESDRDIENRDKLLQEHNIKCLHRYSCPDLLVPLSSHSYVRHNLVPVKIKVRKVMIKLKCNVSCEIVR